MKTFKKNFRPVSLTSNRQISVFHGSNLTKEMNLNERELFTNHRWLTAVYTYFIERQQRHLQKRVEKIHEYHSQEIVGDNDFAV